MNRTHELKIWPRHFNDILAGTKCYEVRENDRAFHVGDTVHLREWDPETSTYSGQDCYVRINHLTDSNTFDFIPNWLVIFGIEILSHSQK